MAVRKDFSDRYFKVSANLLHDGWLSFIAEFTDSFLYMDEKLISYRLHGHNVCGVGDVDLLRNGSYEQLLERRKKRLKKEILTSPLYYQDYAEKMYRTYQELKDFLDEKHLNNVEKEEKLCECIEFWRNRKNIQKMKWHEFKKMRQQFLLENSYEKYTEDRLFYYADVYFWIIYHLFWFKNHHAG